MSTRIVFFGTPDLAVPCFDALLNVKQFDVVACVTAPDKPQGRKQIVVPSPVKQSAIEHGVPVLQPQSLKLSRERGQAFLEQFRALQPDVAVLFAYGKIIPAEVLAVPRLGFVNVHPSLLPLLRGASPIQYAIVEGHIKTGITIMKMDEGMDTGPVLQQLEIPLSAHETAESLYATIKTQAPQFLVSVVDTYIAGAIEPKPQDDSKARYCKIITKEDGLIDWSRPAKEIDQQIRGLNPWPGTYTFCDDKRIKILKAHIGDDGSLVIERVQPEGKKPMPYSDFLKGNSCPKWLT